MRRSLLTTSSLPAARCLLPAGSRQPAIGNYPPRRGSVLILVVALLVLMALIGTAYISTARIDRHSARQHQTNTQIDLLVDGVVAMIEAEIVGGLFDGQDFRAAESDSYNHFTSAFTDLWLADRIPGLHPNGSPLWRSLTAIHPQGGPPGMAYRFDRLDDPDNPVELFGDKEEFQFGIWSLNFGGRLHPALVPLAANGTPVDNPFLAADASGDGIADAGLWKIPGGELDGITYYAAVRVIDNAAAVNASIAWEPDSNNYFPTNVNLVGLLAGDAFQQADQIEELNHYRFNNRIPTNNPAASTTPVNDPENGGSPQQRGDFSFASESEAFWMQVGRRLRNPGYNVDPTGELRPYRALPIGDAIALAERFTLVRPEVRQAYDRNPPGNSPALVERAMAQSLVEDMPDRPYPRTTPGIANWYAQNFDYDSNVFSLRPLLVGRNPVSNLITVNYFSGGTPAAPAHAAMPAYNPVTPRTSINTAGFAELWRAFVDVMREFRIIGGVPTVTPFDIALANYEADNGPLDDAYLGSRFANPPENDPDQAPADFAATIDQHPARMFRSAIRDPRPAPGPNLAYLEWEDPANPSNTSRVLGQMLLRSALAAVNTVSLRNWDAGNAVRFELLEILNDRELRAVVDGTAVDVEATVFGLTRQPFITEVFATNDNATEDRDTLERNEHGYVAVELHNPFAADMPLYDATLNAGWVLARIKRDGTSYPAPGLDVDVIHTFSAGDTVPAGGHVVLENYDATGGTTGDEFMAISRPEAVEAAGLITNSISVRRLPDALDHELVLLRPRLGATDPADADKMMPVDQFDFTGFPPPQQPPPEEGAAVTVTIWHYVRANGPGAEWQFVYPGRYDGSLPERRQQGTRAYSYMHVGADPDEPPAPPLNPPMALGAPNPIASYPSPMTIRLVNEAEWFAGSANEYPFHGFGRDGDILRVPYIGAYSIRLDTGELLEMNSITMDAAFAEDTDPNNNTVEQVGRFAPIHRDDNPGPAVDDYAFDPDDPTEEGGEYWDTGNNLPQWRYRWAINILDYFTVQAPHDDYLPNVPVGHPLFATAQRVANGPITNSADANQGNEDTVPLQGLVNINTASWRVLAALPLVVDGSGNVLQELTDDLAKVIVHFRDVDDGTNVPHGPFQNIFELNKVWNTIKDEPNESFRNAMGNEPIPPDSSFEARNAQLIRLSNLITTRSDSFTVYLVVQGWRDAGSANAELVAQRRRAFIIDRSRVTPTDNRPVKHNVPTN